MLKAFGFFPRALHITNGELSIKTLPCLKATESVVYGHPYRDGDWIKMPTSSRVFSLPKTHQITRDNSKNDQHIEFLVWVLGFLVGVRLTTRDAGFLDATPCKPGELVDFLCVGKDLERALGHADIFYVTHHTGQAPGLAVAAIHALFVAQGPHLLCYERLLYLYTALDACYLAASTVLKSRVEHAQRVVAKCLGEQERRARDINAWRPQVTCMAVGCQVPSWARCRIVNNKKQSQLSALRNELIHEGLLSGEPLGFRATQSFDGKPNPIGNPLLEVEHLLCRLIIALLGIPAPEYIGSSIETRNIHDLSVAA